VLVASACLAVDALSFAMLGRLASGLDVVFLVVDAALAPLSVRCSSSW
jgi:hypothetical protein